MQTKTIGVKEFRETFTQVARSVERGNSFIVTHHRKPLFRIEPPVQQKKKQTGKTLMEELKNLQFSSGDPHLSQRIDEIVYGI